MGTSLLASMSRVIAALCLLALVASDPCANYPAERVHECKALQMFQQHIRDHACQNDGAQNNMTGFEEVTLDPDICSLSWVGCNAQMQVTSVDVSQKKMCGSVFECDDDAGICFDLEDLAHLNNLHLEGNRLHGSLPQLSGPEGI